MLYQEQTIHLARIVAGFSLERADVLRHAVGKKKKDEMASLKDEFIAGCQKHGNCSQEEAETWWALVEAGAGYGFNKSHTIEYSLLGYVMAYYKFKHPVEFYKAMLEMAASEQKTREEITKLYYDAMRYGVVIKPPTLDMCNPGFEIHDGQIYYGFTMIRGLGKTSMKKIGMLREIGSLHGLRQVIVDKHVTRNAVIPLIFTGAFDHILSPIRRIQVAKELEVFYSLTDKRKLAVLLLESALLEAGTAEDRNVFQMAIAEWAAENEKQMKRNPQLAIKINDVINYKRLPDEMVQVADKERDYLGVCISYCEADSYREKGLKARRVGELLQMGYSKKPKKLLACVSEQRYITSKKGNKLVIVDLYDTTGKVTGMLVGSGYEKYKKLMGSTVLLLHGKLNGTQFIIEKCSRPKK
jgi:DNA polymerase III alpha subunit